MINTLRIEILESEGALTRLIGLVERRGFHIASMVKSAPAHGRAMVTLDVVSRESSRHADILGRQISRLFDVRAVLPAAANGVPVFATFSPGRSGCPPQP
jgi:acetolactate synthase II small subunit